MWIPIEEDSPLDKNVLLGWWKLWPAKEWTIEVGWIGASNTCHPKSGASNGWRHGQATHYQSLPAPPTPEDDDAVRYFKAMIS